jgi:hypothetical protein
MNCTILTRTNATKPRVASRIAGYRLRCLGQTNLFPDLRQRLHQTPDIRVGVVRRRRYPQHRCSLERYYGACRNLAGFIESGHSVAFLLTRGLADLWRRPLPELFAIADDRLPG